MEKSLKVLEDNRDALLWAEVAAWLHDFWKCTDEHVEYAAADRSAGLDDTYRTRYLDLLGSHEIMLPGEPPIFLRTLVEEYREYRINDASKPWLARVLRLCHNVAHTEKETVYQLIKQTKNDTRRGNAFGYESEHLTGLTSCLADCLKRLSSGDTFERSEFKKDLENVFSYAIADTQRPINEVTLWNWSVVVDAFYKAVLAAALLGYKVEPPTDAHWQLLSIRFDGFAFVEQAVRISDLLVRRKLINDGLDKVRELLEVTYPLGTEIYRDMNGSTFIVPSLGEVPNALKDLLSLEEGPGKTLKMRIESEFSRGTINEKSYLQLGKETVPFIKYEKTEYWTREGGYTHQPTLPIINHLKEKRLAHADPEAVRDWWQNHREDICTVCQVRPQGWGIDNETHYRNRARGDECSLTCQTCKALSRKVCTVCEQRREDRAKNWVALEKLRTTVWIDEVADLQGRLALVVGSFDLEHWLDGKMLFYPWGQGDQRTPSHVVLRVKNIGAKLADGQLLTIGGNNYSWHEKPRVFISQQKIRMRQSPDRFKTKRLFIDSSKEEVIVTDVFQFLDGAYRIKLEKPISSVTVGQACHIRRQEFRVVGDRLELEAVGPEAVGLVKNTILYEGGVIVEQSFELPEMVETQTPARLYRVWETTRKFWEEIEENFEKTVGKTELRLRIWGAFDKDKSANEDLGDYHVYELKLGHVNLSVVHVGGNEFITADNLERVAILLNPTEKRSGDYEDTARRVFDGLVEENNQEKRGIQVEAPTGYGNPAKVLGRLRLHDGLKFEQALDRTAYVPAVPILADPETFMAIVPASKALNVVRGIKDDKTEDSENQRLGIKEQYEEQMGKVRNRLPMIVGVVFAGRRTPLTAILNAGRRMLEQSASDKVGSEDKVWGEDWEVVSIDPPLPRDTWPSQVTLKLKKVNEPGKEAEGSDADRGDTGDLLKQDEQSLTVTIPTVMGDKSTRDEWFPYWRMKSPVAGSWVHVCDLHTSDVVYFTPSRFDFEFLETAAQRFEISYDGDKRRGSKHPRRPYYLEELDEIDLLWKALSDKGGLTTTQIHNLIENIEGTRLEWQGHWNEEAQETFDRLVCDALKEAGWKDKDFPRRDSANFDKLHRAAVSGQLADVVELYMRILKKKPERDQEEVKE